jgi:ribosomal protein S18 acetylase RimI-like enzyme
MARVWGLVSLLALLACPGKASVRVAARAPRSSRIVACAAEQPQPPVAEVTNLTAAPGSGLRLRALSDEDVARASLHNVASMFIAAWFGGATTSDAQVRQLVDEIAADMRRRYSDDRTADASRLVVALDADGLVCGCAGIELISMTVDGRLPASWSERLGAKPRPHMSNLAVAPDRRRSGVASALVHACEHVAAVEWGCSEQTLFVDRANEPAIELYSSLGYRVVSSMPADRPQPRAGQTRRLDPGQAFSWVPTTNAFLVKGLDRDKLRAQGLP